MLDPTDVLLLGRLCRDGRATWAELAGEVGLTPPAVAARVRRLAEQGVIRQFAALVEPEAVGAVTAFVEVTFDDPQAHEEFRQVVSRLVAVQECHRIAGDAHYLVKLRARSSAELETMLVTVLPKAARGATFRVSMVLAAIKESPVFPLPRHE